MLLLYLGLIYIKLHSVQILVYDHVFIHLIITDFTLFLLFINCSALYFYPRNFNEWTQHYLGMKPQIQVHLYIRKAFTQKRTFYTDYNSIYHLRLFSEMYFDQVMTVYTYWTAQLSRHNKMILHKRYISWFWGCFWIELCYMIVVFL